jgi:hypothetical protein
MSANTKSVAELAYELWIARGRPDGSALQDWAEAERQLTRGNAAPPSQVTTETKQQPKKPLAAQGPAAKAPKQKITKKESNVPQPRKRPGKPAGEG